MNEMIPRKIHYCWFGRGEKPSLVKKCIQSWKKNTNDYELIEWNEDNFDINSNKFVKEAYENKKYAFVSDYVRLYALHNYGGIYLDTDVEVLKSLDEFLNFEAFSGFENEDAVPTGIMGCRKGNLLFKELLDYYKERSFVKGNGELDLTTNVHIITKVLIEKGLVLDNKKQDIEGLKLYPKDYFCPKDYKTGKVNITNNTYTIHHFAGSWKPKNNKIKNKIIEIIGDRYTCKIVDLKRGIRKHFRGYVWRG